MNRAFGPATMASVVFLALLVVPAVAPLAGAAPVAQVSNGTGPPQQWAYGGQTWDNVSHVGAGGVYSGHAYFGWQVILTATNTSSSTTEFEAQRTVALSYYAQYCAPDCKSPLLSGNLSLNAWQRQIEFVNLTANATVYENGTPSAAFGVTNGSARASGNLSESFRIVRNATVVRAASLDVVRSAQGQVAFTPALGLVPWNVTPGLSWNATSAFVASGGWHDAYRYSQTLFGNTTSGHGQSNGSISRQGNESVRGFDRGNITLRNGQSVAEIILVVQGPFDLDDGLFVAAHASDLFGGATSDWSVRALGGDLATTARADVVMDHLHHHGRVVAAQASYSAYDGSVGATGGTTGSGTVAGSTPTPQGSVQAQPESVDYAQAQSNCMVGGCSATGPAGFAWAPLVVVGVFGAIAVTVAAVLLMRPKRGTPVSVPSTPYAPSGPQVGPAPPAP